MLQHYFSVERLAAMAGVRCTCPTSTSFPLRKNIELALVPLTHPLSLSLFPGFLRCLQKCSTFSRHPLRISATTPSPCSPAACQGVFGVWVHMYVCTMGFLLYQGSLNAYPLPPLRLPCPRTGRNSGYVLCCPRRTSLLQFASEPSFGQAG